jgi:hypothetical protein
MYVTVPYNKVLFSLLCFFTNQSEVDFGTAYVLTKCMVQKAKSPVKNSRQAALRRGI